MAGLNTEVKRKQKSFHVQTEDKGIGINYIETVIFKSGKILSSQKTSYAAHLNQPDLKQIIQQMIKQQHQECLKELSEGKFDHL
ncbi:MAG: hypothetical protein GF421_02775 [Candidatus Aminicenantes bacterium]|nr:hypothetical protein [Candidatus Aminicenantes bacterium]